MRYCLSKRSTATPSFSMRSNSETTSPALCASTDVTVGGSCFASPTSTALSAFVIGMSAAGSGHCAASSTHATRNVNPSSASSPAPTQVAHTTSAFRNTNWAACVSNCNASRRADAPLAV